LNLVPVIAAKGVCFTYSAQRSVLSSLSLTVAPGEIVAITGASGAGKTTLLTLCGALRSVQTGDLRVLGRDLRMLTHSEQRTLRASLGFIFQAHNLIDALTARQNVVMGLLGQRAPDEASRLASDALKSLGLAHRVDAVPEHLSGGERQRVAVARALVRKPRLILADEPTASLDELSANAVKEALSDAARLDASAMLLVTHDSRLFEIADRLLCLTAGSLQEVRTWDA
jgi:putative ABC transport system ATP-binding protein